MSSAALKAAVVVAATAQPRRLWRGCEVQRRTWNKGKYVDKRFGLLRSSVLSSCRRSSSASQTTRSVHADEDTLVRAPSWLSRAKSECPLLRHGAAARARMAASWPRPWAPRSDYRHACARRRTLYRLAYVASRWPATISPIRSSAQLPR